MLNRLQLSHATYVSVFNYYIVSYSRGAKEVRSYTLRRCKTTYALTETSPNALKAF
jgi:hypothetical protein